jgi:hypothetical protein
MMFGDVEQSLSDGAGEGQTRWPREFLALALAIVPVAIGGFFLSLSYLVS